MKVISMEGGYQPVQQSLLDAIKELDGECSVWVFPGSRQFVVAPPNDSASGLVFTEAHGLVLVCEGDEDADVLKRIDDVYLEVSRGASRVAFSKRWFLAGVPLHCGDMVELRVAGGGGMQDGLFGWLPARWEQEGTEPVLYLDVALPYQATIRDVRDGLFRRPR